MTRAIRPIGKHTKALLGRFLNCSLSMKIIALFAIVLVVSVLITFVLFQAEHDHLRYEEFDSIARQNAQLIAGSIDAMIENLNYVSKMLLSNDNIQSILIGKESFNSPRVMRSLRTLLSSAANLQPHTAALYLFDTTGQRYGVDNYSMQRFSFSKVEDAVWYNALAQQKGYYMLLLNGGENHAIYGNENVISMVRNIYNLNEQSELLGTLMLNLRESFLTASFEDAKLDSNLKVTVVEDGGKPLLSSDSGILSSLPADKQAVLLQAYGPASLLAEGKTPYVYSSARLHNAAWHVITAIPYTSTVRTLAGMEYVFRLLLLLIVPVIFVATLMITRMVTLPLHKMAEGMRLSAGEHPARLPAGKNCDEIGKLTCAYNSMVDQLETLFTNIRTESERKRQAEFHALQAQINPHFLYNTIDTLRALAISGRTKEVNDLLRSLGEFYRNSINNGRSIITVGEEINMVKSYMAIQSVRYIDIATEFDVDESVCASPVPKLTLQPLVENALYHGLRSSGHKGTIRVKAWQDTENVYLSVADDGVGIPEEAVESALKKDPPEEESRFGLRGTIDRLRLFFGESRPVTIESSPGHGTRITITIRKGGEAA